MDVLRCFWSGEKRCFNGKKCFKSVSRVRIKVVNLYGS